MYLFLHLPHLKMLFLDAIHIKHRYFKIVLKIGEDCCGVLQFSLIISAWMYFIILVFASILSENKNSYIFLWNFMWNNVKSLTKIKIFDIHCSSSVTLSKNQDGFDTSWFMAYMADPCMLLLITLFSCRNLLNCLITVASIFLGAEVQLWIYKYPDPSIFCFQYMGTTHLPLMPLLKTAKSLHTVSISSLLPSKK